VLRAGSRSSVGASEARGVDVPHLRQHGIAKHALNQAGLVVECPEHSGVDPAFSKSGTNNLREDPSHRFTKRHFANVGVYFELRRKPKCQFNERPVKEWESSFIGSEKTVSRHSGGEELDLFDVP